jgi:pimeloyl-ACP methyl ester carboxylesterase
MPDIELSDGLNLHYETWGEPESPPIVLLHGFTSSHRMWQPQARALAAGYFVVAPDLRGHGASGSPEDLTTYTIERYAADVRELADHLDFDVFALAGCSFGGMIALQFAVTWPERLACLVVSDASPAYDHPDYDDRFRAREAAMRENEECARKFGMAGLGKRLAASLANPFLAEGLRNRYARLDFNGFLGAAQTRRQRPDLTPLLRERLMMPVLLCDGEDDPVFCALGVMARELPGARVAVFESAGHGLPSQRAEAFNEVLLEFLDDVENGRPIAGRIRV